jgi:7,8-dihydropterin-6-yl-methyl-4-(beta-D-ribofuranosyl)aminobenzene 5'-phosphate synthase
MRPPGRAVVGVLVLATAAAAQEGAPSGEPVKTLKVAVLSTMLAERGVGEWGFAALIEADGQRLLVDTGGRAETVLANAAELGVDLSSVSDVVITHNHSDHTSGLVALRRALAPKNPRALSRVHVGQGIFLSRLGADGREANGLLPLRAAYEAAGGTFVEHAGPTRLLPGVWLTGPVPRTHPERNWSASLRLQTPQGPIEAVFRIRELSGLTRRSAVVSAVGSSFTLGSGIDPLSLAR